MTHYMEGWWWGGVYNGSLHGGLVVGRGFIMAHYMERWWWGGGL